MIAKPAEGLKVFDPSTMRPLPPEGVTVQEGDLYWARLAADGDVELIPDPTPPTPTEAGSPTKDDAK